MTPYEIPLSAQPQILNIALGGVEYQLNVYWNWVSGSWFIDIYDSTGNILQLGGIPLVTGVDLLEQFGYMNFGGMLIAQTDGNIEIPPNYNNLGTTGHLYFVTSP